MARSLLNRQKGVVIKLTGISRFCLSLLILILFSKDLKGQISWEYLQGPPYTNWFVSLVQLDSLNLIASTDYARFKSEDGGKSWTIQTNHYCDSSVLFHHADSVLLSCTRELYSSADRGNTFELLSTDNIYELDIIGVDDRILAATSRGLAILDDQNNWNHVALWGLFVHNLTLAQDSVHVLASTGSGLFLTNPMDSASVTTRIYENGVLDAQLDENGRIWIVTDYPHTAEYSDDLGLSWNVVEVDGWSRSKSLAIVDSQIFLGTKEGLFTSPIDQISWTKISELADIRKIYPLNQGISFQHDTGVHFMAYDGSAGFDAGISTSSLRTMFADDMGGLYTLDSHAGENSLYYHDSNAGWKNVPLQVPYSTMSSLTNSGELVFGIGSSVYTSQDGGENWAQSLSADGHSFRHADNFGSVYSDRVDKTIWKWTRNNQETWDSLLVASNIDFAGQVTSDDKGYLYLAYDMSIAMTKDDGQTWNTYDASHHFFNISPLNDSTVIASYWDEIHKVNLNKKESQIVQNVEHDVIHVVGDNIFIGTDDAGIIHSPDGGITWEEQSVGIPDHNDPRGSYPIRAITSDKNGFAYVALWRTGVFKSNQAFTVDTEDLSTFQFKFDLFPNPIIDKAKLKLSLDKSDRVELALYDILGRKIQGLDLGVLPPGQTEKIIDTSTLSSGTYFAELRSPDGMIGVRKFQVIH